MRSSLFQPTRLSPVKRSQFTGRLSAGNEHPVSVTSPVSTPRSAIIMVIAITRSRAVVTMISLLVGAGLAGAAPAGKHHILKATPEDVQWGWLDPREKPRLTI